VNGGAYDVRGFGDICNIGNVNHHHSSPPRTSRQLKYTKASTKHSLSGAPEQQFLSLTV